jgi:3-hydroxyacyl-CoA dehydrogenase
MSSAKRLPPSPVIFPGDEPFWQAAREGRLLVKHCDACGESHYYPRMHCPLCGHGQTRWREVSGRGTVYSYSIVARSPRPAAPVIVELEEGPRLSSVVVEADVHALRIGDAVQLRFVPTQDGTPAPAFTTPAAERARQYSRHAIEALGSTTAPDAERWREAAIVGAGNMGTGIALAFLAAQIDVCLIDASAEALDGGRQRIEAALAQEVERGRIGADEQARRLSRLRTSTTLQEAASADVFVEAVWEDMRLKREIFAAIDAVAAPHALLATNTSTLDVGEIAAATRRPGTVVGLHFFNPAQVMRLIEVVRSPHTTAATLEAAKALARRIGKVPVVVGICDGFVGNRLMITREREAARLLLEGALPQQIDRVLREFGLPMGTFELQDMAGGIALTYHARKRAGQSDWLIEQLFERGRIGQRAGKGYYRYEPGKRAPIVDPEVTALIVDASRAAGIERRAIADDEIRDRLILPMINEGAKLVEEGIVERASDIDLVWQFGYGWPDWKGGPMYHADTLGAAAVVARLQSLRSAHGERFQPAELLVRLARTGQGITTPTP